MLTVRPCLQFRPSPRRLYMPRQGYKYNSNWHSRVITLTQKKHHHISRKQSVNWFKRKKVDYGSNPTFIRLSKHPTPSFQTHSRFDLLVLLTFPSRSKTIIRKMEKSILPPLHINTIAATPMRTPSTVFTLVVVWIQAFVTFPHFCEEAGGLFVSLVCW
jgi:hypothetical protein